jgi:nucleoid DNA-binding protein
MKLTEIVELIKSDNPQLLGKMPDKKAAQIVRAVLGQVGKSVAGTAEGVVKVPGLGNFRVKNVEREKDGQKLTVRKVAFIVPKPGAKKKEQVEQTEE